MGCFYNDRIEIRENQSVQNATVTIIAGERSGEYTMTDRNGAYTFPDVKKMPYRFTLKKNEPKEVTVYRTEPTRLANGVVSNSPVWVDNSPKTTQKTLGAILILPLLTD